MGKRGPKPDPTRVRIFKGNPSNTPIDGAEPMPPAAGAADPPAWLGAIGCEVWRDVSPQLQALGLLTVIDGGCLALYCEAWQEFHDARQVIARSGMIAVSEKGAEYQHPAVGVKNRAIARIKQLGAEFGMSPASRVGLQVAPTEAYDELEQFKKQG